MSLKRTCDPIDINGTIVEQVESFKAQSDQGFKTLV